MKNDSQNLVSHPIQQAASPTRKYADYIQYNLDVKPDSRWILANTSSKARAFFVYVQEAGDFFANSDYFTRRNGADSFLIKVVLDGEGTLQYNGKTYICPSGTFFWLDCSKNHYYATSKNTDNWHILFVHFWGGESSNYYQRFIEENNDSPVGFIHNYHNAAKIIYKIIDYYSSLSTDYARDIEASNLLTQLMTLLLLEAVEQHKIATKEEPSAVFINVQDYIKNHYSEKITLDSLSEIFFLNKFYIQKHFQLCFGISPINYQNELRIGYSKELLKKTDLSINEIAESLGFSSANYFIKLFKKTEGVTPFRYRNNWYE